MGVGRVGGRELRSRILGNGRERRGLRRRERRRAWSEYLMDHISLGSV